MKKLLICVCLVLLILTVSCDKSDGPSSPSTATPTLSSTPSIPVDRPILIDGSLVSGFGMGVDDAQQYRNWVSSTANSLRIEYLGGLGWGAVFITVGDPVPPPRPYQDFSQYTRLAIEMKGASGGECVQIGMKDADDPDDGSERKLDVWLAAGWITYEFNLASNFDCQFNRVYVVTEFVFPCPGQDTDQTIEVRNIGFRE